MPDDPSFRHERAALAQAAAGHAFAVPEEALRTAYVDAALALHCPALPADAAARVHEQFARVASLAAAVLAFPLTADDEPAPVFRP